jgi:hypothetical protein
MPVPVCANESKFSATGEPSDVMLPPLVNADEGLTNTEIPIAKANMAIKLATRIN